MITGFALEQIRRTNRNLLVVNVVLTVVVLLIPVFAAGYLAECFGGPYPTTMDEVAKLGSVEAAPHRFVTLPLDKSRFESYAYSVTGGNDHKNDYYFFCSIGDGRHLVVNAHTETLPDVFVGSIEGNGGDIEQQVLPAMVGHLQGTPPLAGVSLDGASYRTGMYAMFGLGIPVLALAAWNISKVVRRGRNPLLHPMARELAKIGPAEEMAIALDAEIQAGAQRVKKVLLTPSWLANLRFYTVELVYLGDVAWAYELTTKHKQYGITVNTTHATVIHDVRGRKLVIQLSKQQVQSLVRELGARVPWAYVGFSDRLKEAWAKQRGPFLAEIERRKQEILAARPPEA